jgi:putative endonuclease
MTKGGRGEQVATEYLTAAGYGIVARNVRSRWGEVDIVASRGEEVAFVEVKAWDALTKENLGRSIGATKQRRIRRTAQWFLAQRPELRGRRVRFDVIFITGGERGSVDHMVGVF